MNLQQFFLKKGYDISEKLNWNKNIELWERLLKQLEIHKVTFLKVKGHADDELNNRCDRLAVSEREKFA